MPPIVLHADSLSVSIKGLPILDGISFNIETGSWVGIIGPNGSGKTTLIRALSGIIPFEGLLTFKGKSISSWSRQDLAAQMAVLQQNQSIHFDFTVLDFVLLGRLPHKGWLQGVSLKDQELVEEILHDLNLHAFKDRSITSLSGGERQRVLLAQALTQTPELLLLDEPTANLDIYYQIELLNQVQKLVKDGLTVIAVFHDLQLAMRYADKILVLHKGKQVNFGPGETVITPELLQSVFLIDSRINRDSNNQVYIQYLNTL